MVAESFVTGVEKCHVAPVIAGENNWTADGSPELVLLKRSYLAQEKVSCIQCVIPQKFPGKTMKLVCPTLGNHVEDPSKRTPELRFIVVGLHLKFLDVVQDWRDT